MRILRYACIVIALTAAGVSYADGSATFGTLQVTKLIVMPNESGHSDWVDAIQSAKKSIHLAMYHLTDSAVVNALAAKRQSAGSNFDLRIIVDGKSLTGGYLKAAQPLTDAGVQLRGSSPLFSIMHEKSMIIDGNEAFITAINMTNTAANTRDFGIITSDAGVIQEMDSVFEADWLNAQNKTDNTPALSQSTLAWSPNNSHVKMIQFIDSSTTSLVIQVESLSDADMLAAFSRAAQRGVNVQIVVPMCVLGDTLFDYPALQKLQAAGVQAHVMPYPSSFDQPYMHSKMMVADNQLVYVGSINYSVNSLDKARELGAMFINPQIGSQLMQEFSKDWARSVTPDPNPTTALCKKAS